jgi:putative heme-binding domain-containing protein
MKNDMPIPNIFPTLYTRCRSLTFLFFAANLLVGACLVAQDDPPSAVGPVMKLFKSGRVPVERQGTVVEMICSRGNEHDLRVVFDRLVASDGFAKDLRSNVVEWLIDAAATRKVKPTGELDGIAALMSPDDAHLKLSVIRLASAWKLASFSKSLEAIATGNDNSLEIQQAAIAGLVNIGGEGTRATLLSLAANERPMPVRQLAVNGLAGIDLKLACQQAAALLQQAQPADNAHLVLNAFFDRQEGSAQLASALKAVKIKEDIAKMALRYMYSIGRSDSELSNVLSEAAGVASDPPPPTQEEVAKIVEEVIAKGDANRGEQIFRRSELSCLKCHGINRAGGQVGPDLSAVGVSSPIDYIVNSILNPNLAVKELYVTRIYVLEGGRIVTGVVVNQDDERVVLRDSQGKLVTISQAEIEDEAEGKSLMPQGLTKFLTHDEVVDLVKFISELGMSGPFEMRKTPSIQLWHQLKAPARELTDAIPHLESVRELVLGSAPEQWTSVYGKVSGKLPLDELRNFNEPTVLILQGEVQVNEPGQVAFHVTTPEKFQTWLDDQPMENRQQFSASLTAGRHKLTLRVELGANAGSDLQVEVIKPADSDAQFEVVGGP